MYYLRTKILRKVSPFLKLAHMIMSQSSLIFSPIPGLLY